MLTPSQYEHLCDDIAVLYGQLEESIIQDMARRMMKMGYVSDSTAWQAGLLQESGMLYEDILSEISLLTGQTSQELRRTFENAGITAVRNDQHYSGLLPGIAAAPRSMSDSALQILNAGYIKCAGNLRNLTLTTAVTSQQTFIQACNLAYMQTTSGLMDYQTAIRRAVQSAAASGSHVLYPSGHRDRLDVAVRRAVLTGFGQTARQIALQNAQDLECDLMEITAHSDSRPSHAEWQGQIVSLSGRKGYLTLNDIGYGSPDGFGGVNCRHDWFPFFEGVSVRAYSDERLRELREPHIDIGDGNLYTDYEITQKQRYYERQIREKKRQVIAADAAGDKAEFQKKSVQLKTAEQKLKDFCKLTGFQNDKSRTWVNGFGRSISQKAVHANKNYRNPPSAPSPPSVPKSPKPSSPSGSAARSLTNPAGSGIMNARKDSSSDKIQWPAKGKNLSKEDFRTLRDYAASKGVALTGFKTSDADVQLIKDELDSISQIVKMFPELLGNNRKPLTFALDEYMDSNDFAITNRRMPNVVRLNADAFRNLEKLKEEYGKLVQNGWFVQGTDYKSIVKHELGHLYQAVHHIRDDEIIRIAMKASETNNKSELFQFLKKYLSAYSSDFSDGSEIISEVFSDFFSNARPTKFSLEFMKELLKGREDNDSGQT